MKLGLKPEMMKNKIFFYFASSFILVALCQIVLYFIEKLDHYKVKNEKIIFFFNSHYALYIILISIILLIIFSLLEIKKQEIKYFQILFLSFILAGGLSNLVERLNYGGVIDYFNLFFWQMNLADLLIFFGLISFVVSYFWHKKT